MISVLIIFINAYKQFIQFILYTTAKGPVDIGHALIEWIKSIDPRLYRMLDEDGGGGFVNVFAFIIMEAIKTTCPVSSNMFDIISFTKEHVYIGLQGVSFQEVVTEHVITCFQDDRFILRGSDEEWTNGCLIGNRTFKIAGFVTQIIPLHAMCVLSVDDKWICVDDSTIVEFPLWLVKYIFYKTRLVLFSVSGGDDDQPLKRTF